MAAVLPTASKTLTFACIQTFMNRYDSNWITDAGRIYILVLFYMTLTLIKGHMIAKKQHVCASYLT